MVIGGSTRRRGCSWIHEALVGSLLHPIAVEEKWGPLINELPASLVDPSQLVFIKISASEWPQIAAMAGVGLRLSAASVFTYRAEKKMMEKPGETDASGARVKRFGMATKSG